MKALTALYYYSSNFDHDGYWSRSNDMSSWRRAVDIVRLWHERSRQRSHLAELPDYLLHDIGVTRAEAQAEVAKPFWQA